MSLGGDDDDDDDDEDDDDGLWSASFDLPTILVVMFVLLWNEIKIEKLIDLFARKQQQHDEFNALSFIIIKIFIF